MTRVSAVQTSLTLGCRARGSGFTQFRSVIRVTSAANKISSKRMASLKGPAKRGDISFEHVLLEENDQIDRSSIDTSTLQARLELEDLKIRTKSAIEIFSGALLRVTHYKDGTMTRRFNVDLRYLSPRPLNRLRDSRLARNLVLFCATGTAISSLLIYTHLLLGPTRAVAMAVVSTILMIASIINYVRRLEWEITFRTRHGKAPISILRTSFDRRREGRRIARRLQSLIETAGRPDGRDRNARLRAEVREHYWLAENGVIPSRTCKTAVQRILGVFG